MDRLVLDLRALLRSWRRGKLAVAAALLALSLGFGAVGVALALLDRIVLEPAPYDAPERLVYVDSIPTDTAAINAAADGRVSMADYLDWRERCEAFSHLAVMLEYSFTLTHPEAEPEELHATLASPALFQVLRRDAAHGRTFLAEEEIPGNDAVVLLSHGLWQRRFEADPGVLGRSIELGGLPHLVVGVMPPDFRFPDRATELWSAFAFDRQTRDSLRRERRVLRAVGRLADGISLAQAQGDVDRLATALADEHPATNAGWGIRLVPMRQRHLAPYRTLLGLLVAASIAVLLIATLDVVHLLLARAEERRLDLAIRQALGAGPREELRFSLLEALALALVAAVPGLLFAKAGLRLLRRLSPPELLLFQDTHLGPGVALAILAGGLLCGLLVGFLATVEGWRRRRTGAGEATDTRAVVGTGRGSWGGLLITSEVAAALMLLIGAGLLARSFARLEAVDPGFEREGVLAVQIFLPQARYPSPPQKAAFFRQLLAQLEGAPGLEHAALISAFPLSPVGIELVADVRPESGIVADAGGSADDPDKLRQVPIRITSPGYYQSLGIPLHDGRAFERRDHFRSPKVAVVNAELARRLWPEGTAVGQQLHVDLPWPRTVEVIGVVGNVRHDAISTAPSPEVYLPFEQLPLAGKTLVLRSGLGSEQTLDIAKAAIWAVDDQQPLYSVATAEELVRRSLGEHSLGRLGIGLLAALALVLTLVGIYAMAAQGIGRRTTEIGVRLSLGARPAQLLAVLMKPLLRATLLGVGLGLIAAMALVGLLENLLYGISKVDPMTLLGATVFLILASLLGGLLPAWRALGLEPVKALRRT